MNDAFNMAQVSSRRLFNAAQFRKSDTDYANVFERIFHTRISDQNAYDRVQGMRMSSNTRFPELTVWTGVVGGIANQWRETESRVDSNVRIYCDEGSLQCKVWFRCIL